MAISPIGYRIFMQLSPVVGDPSAYWPTNETTGTTAFDQSDGVNLNLTYSGSPTQGLARGVGYQQQYQVLFDGTDDYAEGTGPTPNNQRTFSVWVNLRGANNTGSNMWIAAQGGASSYAWGLFVTTGNLVGLNIWTTLGANVMAVTSTTTIPTYQWVHLAWTYDSSAPALRLYMNGQLAASSTSSSGTYGTDTTLALGRRPDNAGSKFRGAIGHAAYWSQASSTAVASDRLIWHWYHRGLGRTVPQPGRLLAA